VRDVEGACVCAREGPRMGARVGEVVGCCEEDEEGTRVANEMVPDYAPKLMGKAMLMAEEMVKG
jgi:hypothetical protein